MAEIVWNCARMHLNVLLCLHTRSISAFIFPHGIFLLTCCDKWPLIITKWIELCDGHIRHPQEKYHANHIIWFSSVIMGDKCFLFVHPPPPHPSESIASLSFAWGDVEAERMERTTGGSKKKGWMRGEKTRWLCALLRARECPQVVKFHVSFAHSEKPKKWNVCSDREIDSGKERCKHRVAYANICPQLAPAWLNFCISHLSFSLSETKIHTHTYKNILTKRDVNSKQHTTM